MEYLVDSSDVVVLGTVGDITQETVDVDVLETLKGEAAKRITVLIHPTAEESAELQQGRKEGRKVYWFLQREGERLKLDDIDDRAYNLTFSQGGRRLFPMRIGGYFFAVEDRLKEAIRQEAIARPGRNDRSIVLTIPNRGLTLTLPLDDRIEPMARSWVSPQSGDAGTRFNGVLLLRHFKSEENIEILKALVNDPGTITEDRTTSDFKTEAAKVLTEWGIPLPQSVVPAPLDPKSIYRKPIRVAINGEEVHFEKGVSRPRLIGGRAYARVCSISKALGVKTWGYDLQNIKGVLVENGSEPIDMPADSHNVWVGYRIENSPFPSRVVAGELYLPIRWVVERLGGTVKWNPKLRRVEITKH